MKEITHQMITASAGAGKTYQLVGRYLALLLQGREPERLIALTFSRKAAGEFFDRIFLRLVESIEHGEVRVELAEQLGMAPGSLTRETLIEALGRMVGSLSRLRLGTLDSLFVQVLQTCYLEFGFSGGFTLLSEAEIEEARRSVCQVLFEQREEDQQKLVRAFQKATTGTEEKSMLNGLLRFVNQHYPTYLNGSEEDKWGGEEAIWPGGCPWLQTPPDPSESLAGLTRALEADPAFVGTGRPNQMRKALLKVAVNLAQVTPLQRLESVTGNLLASVLLGAEACRNGAGVISFHGDKPLDPMASQHLYGLVHHVLHCELSAARDRTRGIWQILNSFHEVYEREIRGRGRLTFDDVQRLLAGNHLLSQQSDPVDRELALLDISYRLDARFDHWMLDEFQDTSRVQWKVLQNLINEVVSHGDPAERSLFYVGDTKQSIFGWRGGDPRLFREIEQHYNQHGGDIIGEVPLSQSWRCAQAVIDTVNRVFGDRGVIQSLGSEALADRWVGDWEAHTTARDDEGYAALISTTAPRGRGGAPAVRHFEVALQLIQQVQPLKRGLSCAILVRGNQTGREVADWIREHSEYEVQRDAESHPVTDNALGSAFLSLFKCVAHPGDRFSWNHLQLTPFAAALTEAQLDWAALIRETLDQVHGEGFEACVRTWLGRLDFGEAGLGDFGRWRVESLCEAVAAFDESGSRDVVALVRFLENYREKESSAKGRIQVMTVHKAKGLEFDMVIVLEQGKTGFRDVGNATFASQMEEEEVFVTETDDSGSLKWALDMPRRTIASADLVLREYNERRGDENGFENLCVAYVALTRAKHGLYLVGDQPGESSKSFNFTRLLHEALSESSGDFSKKAQPSYENGNAAWYETVGREETAPEEESGAVQGAVSSFERVGLVLRDTPAPLQRLTPSSQKAIDSATAGAEGSEPDSEAERVLTSGHGWLAGLRKGREARKRGEAVHALFEQIEWLDGFEDEEAIRRHWSVGAVVTEADPEFLEAVVEEALGCLRREEVAGLFKRPEGDLKMEVWRERSFARISEDGRLHSGVFDRVLVERDGAGDPVRAMLIDFKTDRIGEGDQVLAEAEARHEGQMVAYRKALAALLGLEESAIEVRLVFTRG